MSGTIAFVSDAVPVTDPNVYETRLDGTGKRRLTRLPAAGNEWIPPETVAVAPDLRHIAYAVGTAGADQVVIARRDGAQARRVASLANVSEIEWSPDSRLLAIGAGSRVVVASLRQPGIRGLGRGRIAGWSPDSRFLAISIRDTRIDFWTPAGRRAWAAPGLQVNWAPDSHRVVVGTAIAAADDRRVRRLPNPWCLSRSPVE
jgi:hypothetical protein